MKTHILVNLLLLVAALPAIATDTLTLARIETHFMMPSEKGRGQIECNLKAEYPVGGTQALQNNMRTWITETLREVVPASGEEVENPVLSDLEGDFLEAARAEAQVAAKSGKSFGLALDARLTRSYESDRAVTLSLEIVRYGAEETYPPINRSITFVKATGTMLTWNDLLLTDAKSRNKFKTALVKQILRYFSMSSYSDLQARLTIEPKPEQADFPLSTLPPALTPNGLRIEYRPGELIAEQTTSIIAFIPLSDVKSTFTAAAKKYLK